MSFNSLRAFLKQLHRVFAAVSGLFGASADAPAAGGPSRASAAAERMLLLLGALLCAYTVSSVMLMRAQMPVAHRSIVTAALGLEDSSGDSEFDAVHRCGRHHRRRSTRVPPSLPRRRCTIAATLRAIPPAAPCRSPHHYLESAPHVASRRSPCGPGLTESLRQHVLRLTASSSVSRLTCVTADMCYG